MPFSAWCSRVFVDLATSGMIASAPHFDPAAILDNNGSTDAMSGKDMGKKKASGHPVKCQTVEIVVGWLT